MKTTNLGPYKRFLERLSEARNAAGCSQAELGRKLGKPQSYVSKVEAGERRLDIVEFIYWAKALGIEPAGFFTELADSIGSVGLGGRRRAVLKKANTAS